MHDVLFEEKGLRDPELWALRELHPVHLEPGEVPNLPLEDRGGGEDQHSGKCGFPIPSYLILSYYELMFNLDRTFQMQDTNKSVSTLSGRTRIKIVLLGNQSVGKTCIIEKYIKN